MSLESQLEISQIGWYYLVIDYIREYFPLGTEKRGDEPRPSRIGPGITRGFGVCE